MSFSRRGHPLAEEEKSTDAAKARARAMELLAGQELSSGQLYERLGRKFTQPTAAAVVAEMVERQYVDDERYARTRAHGLLVARNTGHRHLYAAQVGVTVNLAGIRHTRQHGAGDIQRVQQCIIPVQLVDIIQHGAAGVGSVRYMHLAAGQLPHQPAVHRAKQNFSRLCALPCARHMVQNPLDFGCGKVGIRHKAGILFDILCHARLAEQLIHQRCSAAALPHNGVINGAAGRFFPQNRGFALVGNADGGNIMRIHAALGYHLVHHAILAGPYLHGVVLHPALLGV